MQAWLELVYTAVSNPRAYWKGAYSRLPEQARDFLAAVKRAPELVRRFLDQVLSVEREPVRKPSRRRRSTER